MIAMISSALSGQFTMTYSEFLTIFIAWILSIILVHGLDTFRFEDQEEE